MKKLYALIGALLVIIALSAVALTQRHKQRNASTLAINIP